MKYNTNQKQSHLVWSQIIRIILSIIQVISCIIYLVWVDIQISSITILLVLSLAFPLFIYFCYWMRTIWKVEMKNKQIEIRRAPNPPLKKCTLFISWVPLSMLLSLLQKLQISGYVIFHYIYKKFGIMLTSDLIELMSIDADQRLVNGYLSREKTFSKQNTYIEIKQNANMNHETTPFQQQLSISVINNQNYQDGSPKKNALNVNNNNNNNNLNNSRVINPVQIQLQSNNSNQTTTQNKNNQIRKKIIQTQTRDLEEDFIPIFNTDNNNNNTPMKKRPLQLEIDSPIKFHGRHFSHQRRRTKRGSITSNIEQTMTTFGNINSRDYHQEKDIENNLAGKQILNQITRSSTGLASLSNGIYDEHALSLAANQKFQANRFLRERYFQLITTHSNLIELLFSIIPCLISQIINNQIGFDSSHDKLIAYLSLAISFINFIAHLIFFYHFLFEDELLQYFFSSINQIEKKREQLYNIAKAKQGKTIEDNQGFSSVQSNVMLQMMGVFPFPDRVELNSIEKVHQLANCNESSLLDIRYIHINIPGKNLTFDDIIQDLMYIFTNTTNVTSVKLSLSENQTTTKGEFELREQIASWDCITKGAAQKRIVGDQYISYRPEQQIDTTEEMLDLIQNLVQESISLNWFELYLNQGYTDQLGIESILASIKSHSQIQTCFLTADTLKYAVIKKKDILNQIKLELSSDLQSLKIEHSMNALNNDVIEHIYKEKVILKALLSKIVLTKQQLYKFQNQLSQFQNLELLEIHIKHSNK